MSGEKYDYAYIISAKEVQQGGSSHAKILQQMRAGSSVLECGPATGIMTRYLKEQMGCRIYILENDPDCYQQAMKYADGGVCANLEEDDWLTVLAEASFDYILYADVLEHLRDPLAVLRKMRRFLKSDGAVLLSVPNVANGDLIMNLLCDRFTYTPLGLLDNTHVHLFARYDLHEMISAAGYYLAYETCTKVPLFSTEQGAFLPAEKKPALSSALVSHPTCHVYQYICRLTQMESQMLSDIGADSGETPQDARFYLDFGQGLSEENRVNSMPTVLEGGRLRYKLALPEGCIAVRYDPVELQMCILRHLSVKINGVDTEAQPINGLTVGSAVFFANEDPQLSIIPPLGSGELIVETQLDLLTSQSFSAVYQLMLELNAQMEANVIAWAQLEAAYTVQLAELNTQQAELHTQMETEQTAWVLSEVTYTAQMAALNAQLDGLYAKLEAEQTARAQSAATYEAHIAQLEDAVSSFRTQLASAQRARIRAEDAVVKKAAQCSALTATLDEQTRLSAILDAQLEGMRTSWSWKVTRPLRAIKQFVKGLVRE